MTTMESLIGLVNRIQRACTVIGDYGGGTGDNAFNSLCELSQPSPGRRWSGDFSGLSSFDFFFLC